MELRVANSVDRDEWDGLVKSLGGAIFHSCVWADYIRAGHANVQPRFARWVSDGGETIGLALMFAEISARKVLAPLTGILRTDAAPLIGDGCADASLAFAQAIENYARSENIATLSVGSFGGNAGMTAFQQLGFRQTRYWEFALDLSPAEDVLWEAMEYKRHKNIRKAARLGVALEDQNGEDGIANLRRLQGASSERIVARGGQDITRKGEPLADPVKVLLDSGLGRIVCARVEGQVVSTGLFTRFGSVVYHTLSGHGEGALRSQAPTFLLWETIKRYKAEGARWFNFGGCSVAAAEEGHPEHGVYAYKKDFGGQRLDCITFDKVLFPIRHGIGSLLKRAGRGLARQPMRRKHV